MSFEDKVFDVEAALEGRSELEDFKEIMDVLFRVEKELDDLKPRYYSLIRCVKIIEAEKQRHIKNFETEQDNE